MSDLLTAAKNGYYNQVVSLLNCQSCDVNARDKDKATPLYWSASRGHAKICQELVLAGCDVNACVKWGSTALHAAADRGHADCLTVLLNSGADVQIQNERGDTALHLAAYRGYRDLVELLVTTGRADPFLKNNQSKTPLQEAQSQQHSATAKALQHYMESLGCHRFKSLPMSDSSSRKSSPQEQPTSSTPAQSWPRYQSFPKFPDPTLLTDLARPHTHPQLINNLSQGAGSVTGSVDTSLLFQGPGRSEAGRDTVTGIAGLQGLPGFVTSPGERLQPFHRDPQENIDEGVDYGRVQTAQFRHAETGGDARYHGLPHHPSNGVGLNQLSGPSPSGHVLSVDGGMNASSGGPHVRHGAQSSSSSAAWRHQNGKDGVHGVSKTYGYETDFHPPVMTPPPHRHQHQSFVKHEDLTLFAESLQLEVVKLRDSLSSKELQVTELEKTVSSQKTQNAQLQHVMAEKQSRFKETLASKESEIAELTRRLQETERHNLCLQQAFAERQESSNQMSAQNESRVLELTARVSELERLNRSLQQLLSRHQEMMKGALASKDLELAAWKGKVTALTPITAPRSVVDTGTSCSSTDKFPGYEQPSTSKSSQHHSVDDSEPGKEFVQKQDSSKSSAMTSVCDRSETHPIQQTPFPQTQSGIIRSSDTSHKTGDHVAATGISPMDSASMVTNSGYKPRPESARLLQCQLRASVARLFQDPADTWKLDADGREWTEGREFQLLDAKPVNCGSDGERKGSCSLVFSIKHQGRKYMLKMLTNLINMSYEAHSQGRSLDAHLLHCFGAEFHAPLLLHQHANIVRVRHHYQGDTRQFSGYLHLLVPPSLDVPVDMARRTTFLVLDHYPLTLQTFVERFWKSKDFRHDQRHPDKAQVQGQGQTRVQAQAQAQAQETHGGGFRQLERQNLPEGKSVEQQFLLQVVYQLFSAVDYLQRHEVVHRDIKADNVFLDWRLRPVLGDFGLARTLQGYRGQTLAPFTDRCQVVAGNSHAWAPELCRWSRVDPSTLTQPTTLKDIYSKSDGFAVARMFYHLFDGSSNNSNNKDADDSDDKSSSCSNNSSSNNSSSNNSSNGSEDWFPTSTLQQPHYADSALRLLQGPVCEGLAYVLRSMVLNNPADRPSVRQALCRVGVLLFRPEGRLTMVDQAEEFFTSQLQELSALSSASEVSRASEPEEETLSMAESVAANQKHCLADFLLTFSGEEFWEAYTEMTKLGF